MRFLAWVLGLLFAFGAAGVKPAETDEELRDKVRSHIDVIVDEGAAILDDVAESLREDERVQEAGRFLQDVIEVTGETAEDLEGVFDDACERIEERFGPEAPSKV